MSYRYRRPELHQEEDDVPRWKVVVALSLVAVISAVLVLWARALVDGRAAALRPSGVFPEQWLGPRHLVARVRQDLFTERRPGETLIARQRRELESYGWADHGRGLVRIPIETAIELVARGERP
jgi:peptidoglycan/LPS O-acetylase OafA/YrhL